MTIAKRGAIWQKCPNPAKLAAGRKGLMFQARYTPVEAALVRSYSVPKDAVGAFRAKLTALQKQALLGSENMPGKGQALMYSPDLLHRLIFACELFEFGIAPSVVLALVNSLWERRLRRIFRDAETAAMRDPGPDDVIFYMGGVHLMTDVWSKAVPNVNSCPLHKLPNHMSAWMAMAPDDPAGLPPRALVTNLSMRLRSFHRAFAETFLADALAERGSKSAGRRRGRGK
jgi:hypothetical protein